MKVLALQIVVLLGNLTIWCLFAQASDLSSSETRSFNRSVFPSDFIFGTASSSYQVEGAANEDGRGPSTWDDITHLYPEKIIDGSNGDVTEDFYHHYKDDIKLMKSFGLDAYRFSISWSRILPYGKLGKGINQKGIEFYNNLINELISNGIEPFVTIFHIDLPQALQDEYGGFVSPLILNDYKDFAELCFKEFGDRVKYWMTINEPYMYSFVGYMADLFIGNKATDPYLVAHNMLLCHATTVQLYRKKYKFVFEPKKRLEISFDKPYRLMTSIDATTYLVDQYSKKLAVATQNGQIGIVLLSHWMVPYSNSIADSMAAQRALDFMFGWFMDPLTYGEYPEIMRTLVGSRLPEFSVDQATLVKGSYDFLGVNYYTGAYVANYPSPNNITTVDTDPQIIQTFERNGEPIGAPTGGEKFYVYPQGFYKLLVYIKKIYNNPTIYVTENGMPDSNNLSAPQLIKDTQRVEFHFRHLMALNKAIRDGVNVKGYFVWSFTDTWEWITGYTLRFGLNYVDYKNGLRRIHKLSGLWFKKFLKQDKTSDLVQYI